MDTQKIYHEMGISSAVLEFCRSAEEELKPRFAAAVTPLAGSGSAAWPGRLPPRGWAGLFRASA